MRLIGSFLITIIIASLVLVVLINKSKLKPPVVIEYKSPKKWIILKGANHKRKFLDGEKAKLIWYEHAVGDTLRTEELR